MLESNETQAYTEKGTGNPARKQEAICMVYGCVLGRWDEVNS